MGIYSPTPNESSQGGFRNWVINGDLSTWQRGDGPYSSSTASDSWTGAYFGSVDRFCISGANNSTNLFLKKVIVPIKRFMYGATLPGNNQGVMTVIEDGTCRLIPGKTYTISVFSNKELDLQTGLKGGSSLGATYGPMKTLTSESGFTRYYRNVTIPDPIPSDIGSGHLRIYLINQGADELIFTGLQFEEGPYPTEFESLHPHLTERLCRRYCIKTDQINQFVQENNGNGTQAALNFCFPVTMHATPTVKTGYLTYHANWQLSSYVVSPNSLSARGTSIGGYGYRDVRCAGYFVAEEIL